MKKRTCNKCEEEKPLTKEYYHADKKSREGMSLACKDCRNALKQENKVPKVQNTHIAPPKIIQPASVPKKAPTPQKVVVHEEIKEPNIVNIQALSKKLDSRFTITIDKNAKIENIQCHGRGYKAGYRKEALSKLLNSLMV